MHEWQWAQYLSTLLKALQIRNVLFTLIMIFQLHSTGRKRADRVGESESQAGRSVAQRTHDTRESLMAGSVKMGAAGAMGAVPF